MRERGLMHRRDFIRLNLGAAGLLAVTPSSVFGDHHGVSDVFKISLAQWSLNKHLKAGRFTNLDFPRITKEEFGIDCVEYVDQFFRDKARDRRYLNELKGITDDLGVSNGLIMIDTNGSLGAETKAARDKAIHITFDWIEAAKHLGCHTVRVNAYGPGSREELKGRIVESCSKLADFAADRGLNVVIENHGGASSDADWLVGVIKAVGKENFGTLPDFGNFPAETDRYEAIEKMMPFALAVSAKSSGFKNETWKPATNFARMMRIVRDGGYTGHVGIESGGATIDDEFFAVRATREALIAVQEHQKKCRPLFNGRNLEGWEVVEGGEWLIEDGELIGKNGRNWSTNPEVTGSYLRTRREYADFRLEFQFLLNEKGNSGVFFRCGKEKNPAFTGYEMQVYDAPGREPATWGPGAIYDVVAPSSNPLRPSGHWNSATIEARNTRVKVEMNGVPIVETDLPRSLKGHIGLQNHDEKSVVRYKNIRLEVL